MPGVPQRVRTVWRQQLDPYGGFTTISVVVASVLFLSWMAWQSLPQTISTDELRGVAVAIAPASHISDLNDLIIPVGEPPAGGPHFITPLRANKYSDPVADGNAIHSLEHGMVWITYNRDKVSEADVKALEKIQGNHSRDVILSPRPENEIAIGVVSWGRLLRLDKLDQKAIEDFIKVNRDRSPEPGVR
ncbi:MAG: DUF3105 domain-containing protein [Dehalococcoidia bacterium]|nr:DUF3105 domain-containing protein [Dehalococcoidia bacterium]